MSRKRGEPASARTMPVAAPRHREAYRRDRRSGGKGRSNRAVRATVHAPYVSAAGGDGVDFDILADRQAAIQADVLESPRDAVFGEVLGSPPGQVFAVEHDRAFGRYLEAGQHVDEGGLAGAVRADQPVNLAARDRHRDSGDRLQSPKETAIFSPSRRSFCGGAEFISPALRRATMPHFGPTPPRIRHATKPIPARKLLRKKIQAMRMIFNKLDEGRCRRYRET